MVSFSKTTSTNLEIQWGYIYAERLTPSRRSYVLPTPLHTVALSILVSGQVGLPSDLNKLVWEVVGRFKPSQLSFPIRRARPIPNLFHAVFDQAGHNVTLYNNRVMMALLENH